MSKEMDLDIIKQNCQVSFIQYVLQSHFTSLPPLFASILFFAFVLEYSSCELILFLLFR